MSIAIVTGSAGLIGAESQQERCRRKDNIEWWGLRFGRHPAAAVPTPQRADDHRPHKRARASYRLTMRTPVRKLPRYNEIAIADADNKIICHVMQGAQANSIADEIVKAFNKKRWPQLWWCRSPLDWRYTRNDWTWDRG